MAGKDGLKHCTYNDISVWPCKVYFLLCQFGFLATSHSIAKCYRYCLEVEQVISERKISQFINFLDKAHSAVLGISLMMAQSWSLLSCVPSSVSLAILVVMPLTLNLRGSIKIQCTFVILGLSVLINW